MVKQNSLKTLFEALDAMCKQITIASALGFHGGTITCNGSNFSYEVNSQEGSCRVVVNYTSYYLERRYYYDISKQFSFFFGVARDAEAFNKKLMGQWEEAKEILAPYVLEGKISPEA